MPKRVILMRHGLTDKDQLTEQGAQQTQSVAQQMLEIEFMPDLILHSPFPGSIQTAAVIVGQYKNAGKTITSRVDNNLTGDERKIPQSLSDLKKEAAVLIISDDRAIRAANICLFAHPGELECSHALVVDYDQDDWCIIASSPNSQRQVFTLEPVIG